MVWGLDWGKDLHTARFNYCVVQALSSQRLRVMSPLWSQLPFFDEFWVFNPISIYVTI